MINVITIARQLLSCQGWTKIWIALLVARQHLLPKLRRVAPIRRTTATPMHQPAITLLAVSLVEPPRLPIVQTTYLGRLLLLQLSQLHSGKQLEPLPLLQAHLQMSFHFAHPFG